MPKETMGEHLSRWRDTTLQDLSYALRLLVKHRAFAFVSVLTLALGIGANTAIFTVLNAVLLRPLPYNEPERLVLVSGAPISLGNRQKQTLDLSAANLLDWKDQVQSMESIALCSALAAGVNVTDGGEPERVQTAEVTSNFFSTMGVMPAQGRAFLPTEQQPGENRVAVIGDAFWRRRFGGNPDLVGRTLILNGERFTVRGVAPPGFDYPGKVELWVPVAFADRVLSGGAVPNRVIGRLKPGASLAQARAEMDLFSQRLKQDSPARYSRMKVEVTPLFEVLVKGIRPTLFIIFGAVGLLLVIACTNVANLSLGRVAARQKEISIRLSLGAGRLRLIRQLLVESLVLSLLGGIVGILLAYWMVKLLAALAPSDLPRLNEIRMDSRVFAFTFLISILTGALFGLASSLQSLKVDLNKNLKEGTVLTGSGFRFVSPRNLLVVSEVALALILLVGAGLLVRSFWRLLQINPGFNADRVLTLAIDLPDGTYPEDAQKVTFYQRIIEQLQSRTGVSAVGATSSLPFDEELAISSAFTVLGSQPVKPGDRHSALMISVSPDYFRAMGITLLEGRYLANQDRSGAPPVAVINQTMARRFWPGETPIGRRLMVDGEQTPREIVGIVGDVKHLSLERQWDPEMYLPYQQETRPPSVLVIRTINDPHGMVSAVKADVQTLDKSLPIYNIKTMDERLADSLARRRFTLLLLAVFAVIALILATTGMYGVMTYAVTQRTREIGIRMALGAQTRDVLKLVVGHGLVLILLGVVIGVAGAIALTRVMASLLFEVTTNDPETFVAIVLLLTLVALLASYIPARRAAKIDPLIALKYE